MIYNKVISIETTEEEDIHIEAVFKILDDLRNLSEAEEGLKEDADQAYKALLNVLDYLNT